MNKKEYSVFLPWWAWIIVLMEAIVPTIFGLATLMDPGTYIEGAQRVTYEIGLYITRNLTTALGIVLAILFRSHVAIFILIIVRMMTDIVDMFNATTNGGGADVVQSIPYLVFILIVIPSFALIYLWRQIRSN